MSPTSVERGQETRARLLEAAVQLIVQEGWGAVTTRKVAAVAGLRPGLVHYHFDTVADLLVDASLGTARREIERALTPEPGSAGQPLDLGRILEILAEYSADDRVTILFTEMYLASVRNERLRQGLTALLDEWRTAMAGLLRAHGGPEDSEATAVVLGAVVDGLVLHRLISPELASVPVEGPLRRLLGAGRPDGGAERPAG